MGEFYFKYYIFCLSLIFIRETSSCNDLLDNSPDSEETACLTGDSVFPDTIESHDDPSTKTSEQTIFRFPRSEESAITGDEKKDVNTLNKEDVHLGPFFNFSPKPTIILIIIVCALLSLFFLYSIHKCLFDRLRNMNENKSKISLNDSVIDDFDSLHNISVGNDITKRMDHLEEFFCDPNLTRMRDYDVNASTLNVANLSFSLNSERTESPQARTGTPDSTENDPNPSSASDFNASEMRMESISSSDDETHQYRTNSKCDLTDSLTDVKSANASNKPCVEMELDEGS